MSQRHKVTLVLTIDNISGAEVSALQKTSYTQEHVSMSELLLGMDFICSSAQVEQTSGGTFDTTFEFRQITGD
jgi:hypothetical protein